MRPNPPDAYGASWLPHDIRALRLSRTRQKLPTITTSDSPLLAANPNRVAVLVSPPVGSSAGPANKSAVAHNASGAATGVVLSYVVPAGKTARLTSATLFLTNLAPTVALQWIHGGATVTLISLAANGQFLGDVELAAGDTVQWNVTAAVAASTFDATLSLLEITGEERVTLSFGQAPAVLDQGIQLYQAGAPVLLLLKWYGEAIRNEIRAISAIASNTLAVTEVELLDSP